MTFICPDCKEKISAQDVNIQENIAKCAACNTMFKATDLLTEAQLGKLLEPPANSKVKVRLLGEDSYEWVLPKTGLSQKTKITVAAIAMAGIAIIVFAYVFLSLDPPTIVAILFGVGGFLPMLLMLVFFSIFYVNAKLEKQTLRISKTAIQLKKERPLRPKVYDISVSSINRIEMAKINPSKGFYNFNKKIWAPEEELVGKFVEVPQLTHDIHTDILFFEDADKYTKEWAVSCLKLIL